MADFFFKDEEFETENYAISMYEVNPNNDQYFCLAVPEAFSINQKTGAPTLKKEDNGRKLYLEIEGDDFAVQFKKYCDLYFNYRFGETVDGLLSTLLTYKINVKNEDGNETTMTGEKVFKDNYIAKHKELLARLNKLKQEAPKDEVRRLYNILFTIIREEYYGDGHYGKYAEDSDNFVSIEENCCNPNHDHGHQPETTATETTAPETTAPEAGDYYIVGNMTDWAPNAEYKMTKNEAAETEEYMFTLDLTTESQFKVVYVEGEKQTWIPDGMGNNYGENGEITADGTYTVYFRPNADGGDDWFYGCIYVAEAAVETTAPETTAPETTAPETTAPAEGGFYISGTVSGWAPKAEFKLTKNDAADTEEYVFEGLELTTTDQFKVAYSADGVSFKDTDWYPDGMGNNYGENGEITADGTYTVYFRPNVDGGDDWFYGCIYVAEAAVETLLPSTDQTLLPRLLLPRLQLPLRAASTSPVQ